MPHPYLLVYDGDCSICLAWSRRLVRWAGLPDADRVSHHDLDPDLRARVEAAGLKNELKVVHRADGTITGGFEAIRRFGRGTGLAWLVVLSAVPPFRWVFPLGYGLIARNRRVLAPTPGGMVCACDPDPHLGYNLAFAVHAAAVAALGWWAVIAVGDAVLADARASHGPTPRRRCRSCCCVGRRSVGVRRGRRLALGAHHLPWIQARAGLAFVAGSALALAARGAGWGGRSRSRRSRPGRWAAWSSFLLGMRRRHAPAMRALARAPALPRRGDRP